MVADPLVRLPQLLLSGTLLRTHGRLTGREGFVQEATRSLYAASAFSLLADPRLVLIDPLTSLPRALVPAMAEDGSPLMVDEYTWPLGRGEAGSGLDGGLGAAAREAALARDTEARALRRRRAGGPGSESFPAVGAGSHRAEAKGDDGSVEWAAAHAASEPAPNKGTASYFCSLLFTNRVSFQPHAIKRGKSRARLEIKKHLFRTPAAQPEQVHG